MTIREHLTAAADALLDGNVQLHEARLEFERLYLTRALVATTGNQCGAAKLAGVHRNTFSRIVPQLMRHEVVSKFRRPYRRSDVKKPAGKVKREAAA